MTTRLAGATSLIVFAVCLVAGMQTNNSFSTTIGRALVAMAATLMVSLVLGAMAQKMLDENLKHHEEKLENSTKTEGTDR